MPRRFPAKTLRMTSVLTRLSFIGFVTALSSRCVDPVIPQIAWGLRVDPGAVALLSTAFALPFALVQPILGPVADMAGKIRVMLLCLAVLTIASLVCGLATDFKILFIARVVSGMATGGIFPVGLALIGDLVPIKQRQVALGRWLIVIMTGNLLGASVAGVISDLLGWRAVFLVIAGAGLAVFLLAGFTLRQAARAHRPAFNLRNIPAGYAAIFRNPRAKVCYSAVFIEGLAIFGLFPFVALLLLAAGEARASIAGLILGGFSLGGVIYAAIVSLLVRRFRIETLMLAGGLLSALMLGLIAFQLAWPVQLVAFTILGFAFFLLHGSIQVQATELSSTARAAATSLHAFFFFMGQASGPVLFGLGLVWVGAVASIAIGAAVMAAIGIVCWSFFRKQLDQPRPR
jgi:MFS transporter, DHA1 family, inner membrane transport protein